MGLLTAILVLAGGGSLAGTVLLRQRRRGVAVAAAGAVGLAGSGFALTAGLAAAALAAAVVIAVAALIATRLRWLHPRGRLHQAMNALYRCAYVLWWASFLISARLPVLARIVLCAWVLAHLVALPWQLLNDYLYSEVLGRDEWTAPREVDAARARTRGPRVCVQLPCYAEPPEVVCRTLDALARQHYQNFEVLVIDNNTDDDRLWRPVQSYCRQLGDRFRFLHVNPLPGAKAGALNLALRHSGDCDLIAVIDCDYVPAPDFLSSLVGYFDDERLAFVQTAHDYRDFAASAYQRACYGEYRLSYRSYLTSRNEHGAALTVGTMCLVRRTHLVEVGGWSESCDTEDSELSIRLHAAGYHGRYFFATYGRGLIPETYRAYRRQRSRWIRGPAQELRRHWRLYLPGRLATPSALTAMQKLLFAHHGVRELTTGAKTVLGLAAAALLVPLAAGPAPATVTAAAVAGMVAGTSAIAATRWLLQRLDRSVPDAALALLATVSLWFVGWFSGLRGWLGLTQPWGRTPKFSVSSSLTAAAWSVRAELAGGLFWLAVTVRVLAGWPWSPLSALIVLHLLYHVVGCFAAPVLAVLGEYSLRRRPAPRPATAARAELARD
jgi:GT2 family glycosyltransferase